MVRKFLWLGLLIGSPLLPSYCSYIIEGKEPKQIVYTPDSFLALVCAPTLDLMALKHSKHEGVNKGDVLYNIPPLHVLARRKDATIEHIDALLSQGADPTFKLYTHIFIDRNVNIGLNAYDFTIKWVGQTPAASRLETNDEYSGNEEVVRYLFHEILYRKIMALEKKQMQQDNEAHLACRSSDS
jgi:hypothetical protein